MIIDKTGKDFGDFMHGELLSQVGMSHGTYSHPLPKVFERDTATGYLPDGTMVAGQRHTYPEMAPAGLYTSAPALARFFIDIQKAYKGEQGRLLSPKMTREMLTVVDRNMGLGMVVNSSGDEVYFGHGGWNEGFSSEARFHRDRGYGVVCSDQFEPSTTHRRDHQLCRANLWLAQLWAARVREAEDHQAAPRSDCWSLRSGR